MIENSMLDFGSLLGVIFVAKGPHLGTSHECHFETLEGLSLVWQRLLERETTAVQGCAGQCRVVQGSCQLVKLVTSSLLGCT